MMYFTSKMIAHNIHHDLSTRSNESICMVFSEDFRYGMNPDFGGYLCHRGIGVGFLEQLNTTFRPF